MRSVLIFGGIMVGLGVYMAQSANKIDAANTQSAQVVPVRVASADRAMIVSPNSRSVSLAKDRRGHFQADARIDGRNITVMVDTGASVVALNESSAAKLGVRPSRADYTSQVSTANGSVKAARTKLASVDIGGVVVRDVEALVLPDTALSENLLGMAYLSRLKRFEYANGRLVLEQ